MFGLILITPHTCLICFFIVINKKYIKKYICIQQMASRQLIFKLMFFFLYNIKITHNIKITISRFKCPTIIYGTSHMTVFLYYLNIKQLLHIKLFQVHSQVIVLSGFQPKDKQDIDISKRLFLRLSIFPHSTTTTPLISSLL